MNIDTRINNDFFQHPKTIKLQEELGEFAPIFLIKLWLYVSKFFPDGIIKNMSNNMIEKQIGWKHENKSFIEIIEKIGFIELKNNDIVIHDWDDHNQYASTNNTRKDLNRFNTLKRYFPEVANILKNKGIKAISIEQYKAIKSSKNPINEAIKIFKLGIDKEAISHMQSQCNGTCNRNANDKCPNTNNQSNNQNQTNTNSSTNINNLNTISSEQKDCSEQPEALQGEIINPEQEIFIKLPLIDGSEFSVTKERLKFWSECFPAANIEQEFRTMKAWLFAHEKRRKTKGGINRFIQGWLAKAQDNPKFSMQKTSNGNNYNNANKTQHVIDEQSRIMREIIEEDLQKQGEYHG